MCVWAWRTPGCAETTGYNTVCACTRYGAQAVAWMLRRHDVKVSSGCEYDVGQGRARRDGSWVGGGAKSDVDSLCDAGEPWKHLECRRMLQRTQNPFFAK